MNKKRISMIRIILLSVIFAAAATGTALMKRGADAELISLSQPSRSQQQSETGLRQSVRVWIHGDAIYPDFIEARPGRIFVHAENETQSDVSIVVEKLIPGQSARQAVTSLMADQKAKRARGELTLETGEYIFYLESQPDVQGRLIVKPE